MGNYEIELALSDISHQLKRIADHLEKIPKEYDMKMFHTDGNAEELKKVVDSIKETDTLIGYQSENLHQDIVEEWNRELVPLGIPKITAIKNDRAKKVAARIKEYGKDSFHVCIEEVKQSSFLQGKGDGRPWTKFSFDWMILPNNFPKVLEGNYNDNRKYQEMEKIAQQYSSAIPESWAN